MKTKAILQKLTGLLVIMSLFFSCQKDLEIVENEDIEVGEGSIAFSFEHVSGMLKNSACDMQDVMAAVITVENSDGSMTDYNSTPVNVYKLGDRVFTQKISLNPGTYNLTEFVLVDSSLNMIYAIPAEGSSLESAVPDPLPM